MIEADRAELEVHLKQRAVEIREKEVALFNDNFGVLATQATFLTGLGFSGLTMDTRFVEVPNHEILQVHITMFYTMATLSVGFNVLTMILASYCMIFGPALAIRGPDGSMTRAVNGMYEERKWVLRFFVTGLFCIMISGIFLGWMKFGSQVAISMTVVFMIFIIATVWYMKVKAEHKFAFPKGAGAITHFLLDGYDPEQNRLVSQRQQQQRRQQQQQRQQQEQQQAQARVAHKKSSSVSFRHRFTRTQSGGAAASTPVAEGASNGPGSPSDGGINGAGTAGENGIRDADRAGFLNKRITRPSMGAKVTRSWKRRLFVLRQSTLTYYTDVKDATGAAGQGPKGEFTLGPNCVIKIEDADAGSTVTFTPSSQHVMSVTWKSGLLLELAAMSEDDLNGWHKKLRIACGLSGSGDDEDSTTLSSNGGTAPADEHSRTSLARMSAASAGRPSAATDSAEASFRASRNSARASGSGQSSKSGLLTKNGKLRFFSVHNNILQYFTLDGVLKRELALDGVAVAVERNSTKALAFKLTVGSKTMELTAQNADELEQWIDVFSRTNDA